MNICYVCEKPKDTNGMCPDCQKELLEAVTREVNGDRRKEENRVERRMRGDV